MGPFEVKAAEINQKRREPGFEKETDEAIAKVLLSDMVREDDGLTEDEPLPEFAIIKKGKNWITHFPD